MGAGTVVIGTVFMDCKGFARDRYDAAGRNVGSVKFIHGGVGRNVAEDMAETGACIKFVSSVDDSALGAAVLNRLKEKGVDVSYVHKSPSSGMGIWLVIMDEHGDLAGSVSQMPDLSIIEKIIREDGEMIISDAENVVLELDLNEYISSEVLRLASKYGKKVYGITGNMEVILRHTEFLPQLECYICNEAEAGRLLGQEIPAANPDEVQKLLSGYIAKNKLKSMIITLGKYGSVFDDGKERGFCPAVPTKVVDTSGAGDAFFAGTTEALVRGSSISDAVKIGTKLASWTIQSPEPVCGKLPEEFFLSAQTGVV